MKIVIALPSSPWPVQRGTGRLIMNLISGLAVNHKVILVTMTQSLEELEKLKQIETESLLVRSIIAPNKRSPLSRAYYRVRNLIAEAVSGIPLETSYSAPTGFLKKIVKVAREEEAELVLANYWHLFRLPSMLEDIPVALITHDIEYLIERPPSASSGREKCGGKVRLELEESIEKKAYRNFDRILTVTRQDAETLIEEMPDKKEAVKPLPLAMDLEEFSPSGAPREKDTLLFTGTFISDFNFDALTYLLDEIVPLLVIKRPSIRIRVAGGGVPEEVKSSVDEHVEFLGYVEDLASELNSASVMVLPLRFAGGVRIRMLEAAAMSLPVVSTSIGVGGMELTDGKEFLLADSPGKMVESILRVFEDRELASSISLGAREWVEKNYSLQDYPDRLEKTLAFIREPRADRLPD